MICETLTKADLKDFRLTCRACARAAAPQLFRELYFSTIRGEFEIAGHVIRHFGPYVRTLLFSSVFFPEISQSSFRAKWKSQGGIQIKDPNCEYHVRRAYQIHCRLQREQKDDLVLGNLTAHLCSALRALPTLEKLFLTDIGAYRTNLRVKPIERCSRRRGLRC